MKTHLWLLEWKDEDGRWRDGAIFDSRSEARAEQQRLWRDPGDKTRIVKFIRAE